jgi:membrane protein DedA with SNARE-associated domain
MDGLIENYGYIAVFVVVLLGAAGLPLPSAAILAAAAVYAGTTHVLDIWVLIGVAIAAVILGSVIGYMLGVRGGPGMLDRVGPRLGLNEQRLKLGQYVFSKYGGVAVLVGRFLGPTRSFVGLLAGVNNMPWGPFVRFTAVGAIIWAMVWGLGSYLVGDSDHKFSMPGGLLTWAILAAVAFVLIRRAWRHLLEEAEAATPDVTDTDAAEANNTASTTQA